MKHFYTVCMLFLIPFLVKGQWQPTNCPAGSGDGKMNLTANGNYVFAGGDGTVIEVSSNNGTTWTATNNGLTATLISCFMVKGSYIYAGSDAGVFRTSNNGADWTPLNNGLTMLFVSSLSNNGTSIFAGAGFGQVFRSDNDGSSWTEVSNGMPATTSSFNTGFVFKDGTVYAGLTGEGVYKSANNGLNWTATNNGMFEPIVQSLLVSGNKILASTEDGLYVSTDDGDNWNIVSMGFPFITTYGLVKKNSTIYLGSTKGVFRSVDNGATWDSINTGLTKHNVEFLAVNDNYLYAMELETGIWRRPLSEIIGVEKYSKVNDYALYPNPAVDKLNIEMPETLQPALVSVYNPNGQLIISRPITNAKTELDISGLAKGIYFVKCDSESGVVVKKFIKE